MYHSVPLDHLSATILLSFARVACSKCNSAGNKRCVDFYSDSNSKRDDMSVMVHLAFH